MANEWIDPAFFEAGDFEVIDAAGVPIQGVESARLTNEGVEVMVYIADENGNAHVFTTDAGVTFDPIRAKAVIPGGVILDLR